MKRKGREGLQMEDRFKGMSVLSLRGRRGDVRDEEEEGEHPVK